jgi:MFS family permease
VAGTSAIATSLRAVPRGVWALGVVSLFMDLSSEMIHALLPVYLVGVLGASTLAVGMIEGIAEATASITKVFSGAISDIVGKRKLLVVLGYGLAAVTKPAFPLAPSLGWIVGARFVDRVGKGIRDAPRDALLADLTPAEVRGAAFGLRQSLDTVGALGGPLAAMALMALLADSFTAVFWVATIPAFVAVAVLVLGVAEPPQANGTKDGATEKRTIDRRGIVRLSKMFWAVVAVAALLTLARFSEAFLVLRAQSVGMTATTVPAVMAVMSLGYALSAYPAGALSDRVGRHRVLLAGFAALLASDLVLAGAGGVAAVMAGAVLWGLHMGLTQGLISALVADSATPNWRGTAYGVMNFATGIAALLASLIAGGLWQAIGPGAAFLAGAVFTALATAGFWTLRYLDAWRLSSWGR